MAVSIVHSCQLRYNLPFINKSVVRPLHIINLSEVNGHASVQQIQFFTFIVHCDVYSSEFLSLQVLDMF